MLLKNTLLNASTLAFAIAAPVTITRTVTETVTASEAIETSSPAAGLTASTIQIISPATASCDGADFPDECADASQAAGPISNSFSKYQITSVGEQAALVALMLYESGSFKYNKNHFPGVPGQGTRNMQSPAFNLKYAQSLFDAGAVAEADAQGPAAVLALVSRDEESFGSAAWFLSSQCPDSIRQELATASAEGWTAYLTQCVGTADNPERDQLWSAAIQAMSGGH